MWGQVLGPCPALPPATPLGCPACPSHLEQAHVVVGAPQLCKGHLAGQALVHDAAQGVDVRAHVNLQGGEGGAGRGRGRGR